MVSRGRPKRQSDQLPAEIKGNSKSLKKVDKKSIEPKSTRNTRGK